METQPQVKKSWADMMDEEDEERRKRESETPKFKQPLPVQKNNRVRKMNIPSNRFNLLDHE
jgi:hypothetical protein